MRILTALALLVAGPRGPLHVCPCGHTMRQGGREGRIEFYARQDEHFATCPAARSAS